MEKGGGEEGGAAGVVDLSRGGISTRAAPEKNCVKADFDATEGTFQGTVSIPSLHL